VQLFAGSLLGATVLYGLYLIAHGLQTPGGGFQGGVACAAGLALLYAAGEYAAFRRASPHSLIELTEGAGAGGYVAIGIAALAAGAAFLANFAGLGSTGSLAAGGTIPWLNWASALEVASALVLLFHEFLEEVMDPRSPGGVRYTRRSAA
jgi:multicomponent Na+:H+ antiporter subunit B